MSRTANKINSLHQVSQQNCRKTVELAFGQQARLWRFFPASAASMLVEVTDVQTCLALRAFQCMFLSPSALGMSNLALDCLGAPYAVAEMTFRALWKFRKPERQAYRCSQ